MPTRRRYRPFAVQQCYKPAKTSLQGAQSVHVDPPVWVPCALPKTQGEETPTPLMRLEDFLDSASTSTPSSQLNKVDGSHLNGGCEGPSKEPLELIGESTNVNESDGRHEQLEEDVEDLEGWSVVSTPSAGDGTCVLL